MQDYDISELKQITASSEVKANADVNKMHYDSMRDLAWAADVEEASIILKIFAVRYPSMMFNVLDNRLNKLSLYLENSTKLMEEINHAKEV